MASFSYSAGQSASAQARHVRARARRYAHDLKTITLEEAVRKMWAFPAQRIGASPTARSARCAHRNSCWCVGWPYRVGCAEGEQ